MSESIGVLVVDDSAFMRYTISNQLSSDGEISIVGTARDGIDALAKIKELQPDVVTMDVEMPRMDGMAALSAIMEQTPVPVIMVSSLTAEGADITIRALTRGAVDFVAKPANGSPVEIHKVRDDLIEKVKAAARLKSFRLKSRALIMTPPSASRPRPDYVPQDFRKVVVIGSSTGGPKALYHVVPQLPADVPAAYVIVQHMPEGFTKSLADRLDEVSPLSVREAGPDDRLACGVALLAPGDFHMLFDSSGRVQLNKGPRIHGLRPAIDVTMESLVKTYGSRCIGAILTGMGTDGTIGASLFKEAGGSVIAEHESTCVVYGMPKSVVDKGHADAVIPLPGIPKRITELIHR